MRSTKIGRLKIFEQCSLKVHICFLFVLSVSGNGSILFLEFSVVLLNQR